MGKVLLGGPSARRVDYVWQGTSLAEAWHRSGHHSGEGEGGERLSIERWHFEPDGLRPLARELVPAGADAEPVPAEAQWLPIVADQLGAPHALFDEDGQCHWRAEPELWGRTRTARALLRERGGAGLGAEGKTTPCALRFPGQWEDAESGLHYNLNRYYDPDTGQYLSPDPIGVDGGLRTHAYVHDPIRWGDPLGLAACTHFKYNQVHNPGPLAQLRGNPASNFAGGRYNATILADDLVLYRGGEAGKPLGQWFTREPPKSVAQVRIDSAVKPQWIDPKTGVYTGSSPIDNVYTVTIPKGTTIYEGPVGYQGGIYLGGPGTNQVFVPEPWKIPGVQVTGTSPIR